MPRIYTKKAFGFVNPDKTKAVNGAAEIVRTTPLGFHDVPEWCREDDMFKWAVSDGNIEIIEVKATEGATGKDEKPAGWKA